MSSSQQIRWIDLSNEEKQEVHRIRNAESARKSRQKKRIEENKIEEKHEEYDRRIDRLESTVDKMTKDLLQDGRGSSGRGGASISGRADNSRNAKPMRSTMSPPGASSSGKLAKSGKSKSTKNRAKPSNGTSDDRPDWFGDAF